MAKCRVFKYTLEKKRKFTLQIPQGAEFLSLKIQPKNSLDPTTIIRGTPGTDFDVVLWAKVDPDAPKLDVKFRSLPTGALAPSKKYAFLDTIQLPGLNGQAVFHVYFNKNDMEADPVAAGIYAGEM